MTKSKLFKLKVRDGLRALLMTIGTGALAAACQSVQLGAIPDPKFILTTGLSAGAVYILKNWLTNSEDKLLTKEPEKRL